MAMIRIRPHIDPFGIFRVLHGKARGQSLGIEYLVSGAVLGIHDLKGPSGSAQAEGIELLKARTPETRIGSELGKEGFVPILANLFIQEMIPFMTESGAAQAILDIETVIQMHGSGRRGRLHGKMDVRAIGAVDAGRQLLSVLDDGGVDDIGRIIQVVRVAAPIALFGGSGEIAIP